MSDSGADAAATDAGLARLVRDGQERDRSAAEADAFLLRGFLSLPEDRQAVLWSCLDEPAGRSSTPLPEPDAPGRQILYDAYLQTYAARVPDRSCRHLIAALAEFVRHGATDDTEGLTGHLSRCDSCGRARTELTAIDRWQRPVLRRGLLLWTGEPSATASSAAEAGTPPAAEAGTRPEPAAAPRPAPRSRARPPHDGGRRPGGRRALTSFAAVGAGAVSALVLAGVVLTMVDSAGTHPSPAGALTLPGSAEPASPAGSWSPAPLSVADSPSATAPVSPSPTASTASASAGPSRARPTESAVPSSTPSSPAPATAAVAPPPSRPVGLPLVNRASGLCVAPTDRSADSPLQLQQCTGQAAQRWELLAADQGGYQLRTADTGLCLDGTTSGGNLVAVTVRSCRSDAQRAEQLWRLEPDAKTGAVRLWFVPSVPSSDDASHLLGPYNWPKADPPRSGSALVQLPDYYHSGSFLFTLG
ncbi:RICIN domain-containing protein [Kitasatospora sp. NPDC096140]|uniref:RICIN domain-containing protein n=1 Tax=Kitasatospora sp. NPDC096140 TaxID=3155425 RepID=UPI0033276361